MKTETLYLATIEQAMKLISSLQAAVSRAMNEECGHARIVLEQVDDDGPWRIKITVIGDEQ